jgi:hypothetical protein
VWHLTLFPLQIGMPFLELSGMPSSKLPAPSFLCEDSMMIKANTDFEHQRAVIARKGRCLEPERAGLPDAEAA